MIYSLCYRLSPVFAFIPNSIVFFFFLSSNSLRSNLVHLKLKCSLISQTTQKKGLCHIPNHLKTMVLILITHPIIIII